MKTPSTPIDIHVPEEKDLGVTIDGELNFDEHITRKAQIANGIVGQIRRSFSYLDCETFRWIFTAFVRLHLEYCQAVRSPHLLRNVDRLENVQIRATKLVDGLACLDYPERLKRLNLPTLAFRRRRGDMIEVYKILKGLTRIDPSAFWVRAARNGARLVKELATNGKRQRQSFFSYRVIQKWNLLPVDLKTAPSLAVFKSRLDEQIMSRPRV